MLGSGVVYCGVLCICMGIYGGRVVAWYAIGCHNLLCSIMWYGCISCMVVF